MYVGFASKVKAVAAPRMRCAIVGLANNRTDIGLRSAELLVRTVDICSQYFSLAGGGQIRVAEGYRPFGYQDGFSANKISLNFKICGSL